MNIFKRGFSLAELLLTIGIIGIITAMGMAITKHTAENAYRGYWYTGYINLYNAIGDFNNRQLFTDSTKSDYIGNNTAFARELNNLFKGTVLSSLVKAKNGITYNIDSKINLENNGGAMYYITMTVPQAKTRKNVNGTGTARLVYLQKKGLLMPVSGGSVNLNERRDLLPVYFDEGIKDNNRIRTMSTREYQSYNQAYCNQSNNKPLKVRTNDGLIYTLVNCNNVYAGISDEDYNGILRFVNPTKLK